jgi:hypothetical protein
LINGTAVAEREVTGAERNNGGRGDRKENCNRCSVVVIVVDVDGAR